MKSFIFLFLLLTLSPISCLNSQSKNDGVVKSNHTQPSKIITPEQARDDLDQMVEIITTTHPNLSFSANPYEIEQKKNALKTSIKEPLSISEFWQVASQLNSFFNDAHIGIRFPVTEFETYKSEGGFIFPIPIYIDDKSSIRVSKNLGDSVAIKIHDEIISINKIKASNIIDHLKIRMRGETPALRNHVMSRNFPAYFWTLYGKQNNFILEFKSDNGKNKTLELSDQIKSSHQNDVSPFMHEVINEFTGYLQVKSFNKALKNEFSEYLKEAFIDFDKAGILKLLIDVRDNPGGAHDVSDLLIPYLTDMPISSTSALTARIVKENLQFSPESKIGDAITIPFREPIETKLNRTPFKGDVFLLVNSNTYSQGIVFSTTLKDNNLAKIVGEETSGNANQTGQVIMKALNNSGLLVAAPIYVIYRPSGNRESGSLLPDIKLKDDRKDSKTMINALLKKLN